MQLVIRPFRPSDREAVRTLFSIGISEHVGPSFKNAMTNPPHIAVTLALCIVGFLLGSVFGAVVLTGLWMGLVYYCCYELFVGVVRIILRTDMQDIPGYYQSRADDSFWVAEAEVDGRSQILGIVAVVAKDDGKEKYGMLLRMIISQSCRRMGLATRLTQTVIDFCKERGFSKVMLETTTTQTAAVALYKKQGFKEIQRHTETYASFWVFLLSNVKFLTMEKQLQP